MVDIILFLLPKAIAAFYVWLAVKDYRRALRKGSIEAHHYWWLGFTLYNFAVYVTWGWLLQIQQFLFWFCLSGFLVSMAISIYRDIQKGKARKAEAKTAMADINAEIEALFADMIRQTLERDAILSSMRGLDAEIAQAEQERGEIISALDLIESQQTPSHEECAAVQIFNTNGGSYASND